MQRRQFLQSLAGLALLGSWGSVLAAPAVTGRMLVVVHLGGGNDGLNTVVPNDSRYLKARPTLGLRSNDVLPLASGLSLARPLTPLHALYQQGKMAVINGVGYAEPNRSHFRSAEIWQTAMPQGAKHNGWLGSYLDVTGRRGLNVDATMNRSFWNDKRPALSVDSPDAFRFESDDALLRSSIDAMYRMKSTPEHMATTWTNLDQALGLMQNSRPTRLPKTDAGKALATVLEFMPAADVYHVTLKGFDTHSAQRQRHARVWDEVSTALAAFWAEIEQRGLASRTAVLVYSEFGRRVEENASGGTDHGTAGPVFIIGPVKGGLYGDYPTLSNLDAGDLRYAVDFRRVYATVLDRWLNTSSSAILGGRFDALPVWG